MKKYLLLLLFTISGFAQAPTNNQYGTRTPFLVPPTTTNKIDVNGGLRINSTTAGFGIPLMTTSEKNAIVSPRIFDLVGDITLGKIQQYNGSEWVDFGGGGSQNLQQTLQIGNLMDTDIEVKGDNFERRRIFQFNPNSGFTHELLFDSDGPLFGLRSYNNVGYANLFLTDGIISMQTSSEYILMNSTLNGIRGGSDYSANLTDLDFTQKKYVDDAIASAGGGATNLSYTPSPTDGTVNSDTGTDATIPLADGTNAGLFLPAEKTKLAGIASGATANTGTVTSVTGVSNETTVANGTTTPVIGISAAYTAARDAVANAKVENNLTASTTVAPSKTAVNTALAEKLNTPTGTANATTFLRGDNVYTDITSRVQVTVIGANNGTGAALTASTMQRNAFWDLQMQIDNVLTNAPFNAVNTSTTALTKAALNTAYPNAPIGFTVQAKDVTTGPMIYIKNTEAGSSDVWLSIVATVTP